MQSRAAEHYAAEYPKGHVLFREGDPGRVMFVLQAGKVRITRLVRRVEKTLAMLGAGDFFGEMALLNNKPRSATATIEEDARLLVIDTQTFDTMINANAEIAARLIRKLAQRLQDANELIENLLIMDHHVRVVHYLASFGSQFGRLVPEGIALDTNSVELAANIGLPAAVVDESLGKLLAADLLRPLGDGLVIPDAGRVRQYLDFLEMKERFGDI